MVESKRAEIISIICQIIYKTYVVEVVRAQK